MACVCGSDLWYYRGESRARGRFDWAAPAVYRLPTSTQRTARDRRERTVLARRRSARIRQPEEDTQHDHHHRPRLSSSSAPDRSAKRSPGGSAPASTSLLADLRIDNADTRPRSSATPASTSPPQPSTSPTAPRSTPSSRPPPHSATSPASSTPPVSRRARRPRRRSSPSTCTAPRSCSRSSATSSPRAAPAIVIASQSGHRLGALTAEQDAALATTPSRRAAGLADAPARPGDRLAPRLPTRQAGNSLRVKAEAVRWGRRARGSTRSAPASSSPPSPATS